MNMWIVQLLNVAFLATLSVIESHTFDSYHNILIRKFSSDGKLSKSQFQKLALDITSNKVPAVYEVDCDLSGSIPCLKNETECLGYDDIFRKYSIDGSMDESSLSQAVPALLSLAQEDQCIETPNQYHAHHTKPTSAQAWGYGLGFVSVIILVSNVGALLGPCMGSDIFNRILMFCVALAVGTLAATGLLVLIPESLGLVGEFSAVPDYNWKLTTALGGVYIVFIFERLLKMVMKRKKDDAEEFEVEKPLQKTNESHGHSHFDTKDIDTGKSPGTIATVAWVLLIGDALHNFVDGLSIGAAFTENVFTGISVSIAIICEELPHELGDIAILLHAGMSMKRALCYNFIAAAVCYVGLVIGILVGENSDANRWIFAFAGGLFIYIALVDMIPEMNEQAAARIKAKTESTFQIFFYQLFGLLVGFSIIILVSYYGKYIDL